MAFAFAALAAAGRATPSSQLVACGSDQVRIYDVADGDIAAPVWSWSAADEHGLPAVFQREGLLKHIDECKPVHGGTAILATASTDGVVLIERASGKALFWARVAMAHSAELLPRQRVVVAASISPQGNRLEVYDLDRPGQLVTASALPSGHGVVWDGGRERLYALGLDALRAYTLADWNGAEPRLSPADVWLLPGKADGHDLSRLPGTGKLLVTTADGVWRFDPASGRFEPYAPMAGLSNVKAVSVEPQSGRIAFQQPEESWWSHHIRLLDPAKALRVEGMRLYKVRWLGSGGDEQ